MTTKNSLSQRKSRGLEAALLAILLIFVLTLAPGPADTQAAANIQPALLALALEQPDTAVRVIIQKSDADVDIEEDIARLGGHILHDLPFIHAVAVELPAGAVPKLAEVASVNWASLDRPLLTAQTTSGASTLRDEFNTASYSNNDGSESWSGDWIETHDNANPTYGDILIFEGELMIKDDDRAIQRSANLTDAATAVLRFDYRRYSFDNAERLCRPPNFYRRGSKLGRTRSFCRAGQRQRHANCQL